MGPIIVNTSSTIERHAGFAAAIAIGESALDSLARTLHAALPLDLLPDHRYAAATACADGAPALRFQSVRLDAPRFALSAAHGGKLGLRWTGQCRRAPKSLSLPSSRASAAPARDFFFDALSLVDARAVLVDGRLAVVLDSAAAAIHELTTWQEPASPGEKLANAARDDLRPLIEQAVRVDLFTRGQMLPPIDIGAVALVVAEANARVSLIACDEALVFGIDVEIGGQRTSGDAAALGNFLHGRDLAIWMNPAALPLAARGLEARIDGLLAPHGAHLQRFSIDAEEGALRVRGSAAASAGSVSFDTRARPTVLHPGGGAGEPLEIALDDFALDVEPAWWATLAGLLNPGEQETLATTLGAMIRGAIGDAMRDAILGGAAHAPGSLQPVVPAARAPAVTMRLVAFECHAQGIFAAARLSSPRVRAAPGEARLPIPAGRHRGSPAASAR